MSGHNKWSKIKHKKGAEDARRGKIFSRLIKEITIAARDGGGGDPAGNPRLRTAIAAARAENMPKDNVERAIKRGTGEIEGVSFEEITFEGYGQGGVAMLVECVTDNRNRTVADVRAAFNKGGGNLGESGSVGWMFETKGYVSIPKEGVEEDAIMEAALEVGANDVEDGDETWDVVTSFEDFTEVREGLEKKGYKIASAEMVKESSTKIKLEGEAAKKFLSLMQRIEDVDDVQNVWANFEMDDALLEELAG